ncbi:protein TESPA1 [Emydura macquarii macquarii]|uniref:protein TESPA1 n=1 Tax=Emydura macquarii macquarii TaxID=1129001 RepID=UPI00352A67C3
MEGASVLSPSSWEKRRAWVRQSRCWRTTMLEEEAAVAMQDVPELQPPHLDDVFLEGSSSSKIETWLQECGAPLEVLPEEPGLPAPYGCSSNGTSFEDDLTLGAEALLLPRNDKAVGSRILLEKPWPGRHLHLGHSMASSAMSSGTNKTSSSISEILERCQEDAEEILYNLGFVQDEPQATARIPSRFFLAPSQAKGIDFQLFLKAQVQRLEMEDPCLTLASRFQQVEALAATADAFFCLYSYVSKTPLQKISPAHVFWACSEIPDIWVMPTKAEATSPVDRLKRAVSKMCLYTSPRADSPRKASGVPSRRRSSLGRVVQEVLERAREERFQFDQTDREGMEEAAHEMPLGTSQCQGGVESSSQEPLSPELAACVSAHLCHGDEAATTTPGGKAQEAEVPGPASLSLGKVPASWVAEEGSTLHGPRWAQTLPLQKNDSFEMEEVQSTSEDEGGTPEAAAWLPAPTLTRHRKSFMLHAHSAQSDSSGFVEEPVPDSTHPTQLAGTASSQLGRPMEDPPAAVPANKSLQEIHQPSSDFQAELGTA